MKLAIKIFIIFALLFPTFIGYAQVDRTEVIINMQIASSKIYLDGKLLNDYNSDLTISSNNNYYELYTIGSSFLVSTGERLLNVEHIQIQAEYKSSFKNIFTKGSIFNDKDYNNIKFDFTKENDEELFYDKPIFKLLLGSFVALGAATAYFKIKADRRFKDYKKTNNQSLLDDTNKYDAISGVTFTLMQINFGVLVYYFLRD